MNLEKLIAEEFPQREGLIYLNHAGVAPWPKRTSDAIIRFAQENLTEGPTDYVRWQKVETELRKQLQHLINAPSCDDIALLKNTSEGLSVIAYGLPWQHGDNIVISDQEFPSNRIVWESLQDQGVELRQADLNKTGIPEDALFRLVDNKTRLIAISSVQYATGLHVDLKTLGDFCHHKNILFCVDAIQSLGAFNMDVQDIHADFVVADGHKWMLGPEGIAVFYCHPEVRDRLKLRQFGWHMVEHQGDYDRRDWQIAKSARRFECGSPNMLGIHGLQASLSLLLEIGMELIEGKVLENTRLLNKMIDECDNLELLSSSLVDRLSGIVSLRHIHHPPAKLHQYLKDQGIYSAVRGKALRLSPHFYSSHNQLSTVVESLVGPIN